MMINSVLQKAVGVKPIVLVFLLCGRYNNDTISG